jgi:hypothetical protein
VIGEPKAPLDIAGTAQLTFSGKSRSTRPCHHSDTIRPGPPQSGEHLSTFLNNCSARWERGGTGSNNDGILSLHSNLSPLRLTIFLAYFLCKEDWWADKLWPAGFALSRAGRNIRTAEGREFQSRYLQKSRIRHLPFSASWKIAAKFESAALSVDSWVSSLPYPWLLNHCEPKASKVRLARSQRFPRPIT